MSDSELSEASATPVPPERELEKSLRHEVVKAQRQGLEFSYNSIRAAAETSLGLTPGFYKSHAEWKQRSKHVIDKQMETEDPPSSPLQSTKPKPDPNPKSKPKPKPNSKNRASVETKPARRKRQKTAEKESDASEEDDLSSPLSDVDSEVVQEKSKKDPKQKQKQNQPKSVSEKPRATKPKTAESDSDEAEEANETKEKEASEDTPAVGDADNGSESELSVLLDEAPPPTKKRKPKDRSSAGPKAQAKKTARIKKEADLDPDQAEITRLQGWLAKCGIRKFWGKELKPYETAKAKIKHLKEMLADAGMTGRYSIEKANQIKEARELAADIEAVQEGAERWGADEDEDRNAKQDGQGTGTGTGARRLVRGAKNYDFLSSDGEETD
ncbi:hypothetical protein A1O3_03007 [Capronia epimyces CBS 606.96]|uniref:Transcriptional regulator n=1 Tax=Capronia epimyces CBS 606.96 TaxID=1182542 RepID=W9YJU4_9EURO|nr:uncharacterized protein A1O3_03007 [Capronia epimyces CBS 606.96]EXJ89940.1 hypothetical protein A1O3_03007 [Capronia epimyces CBS 606.96]